MDIQFFQKIGGGFCIESVKMIKSMKKYIVKILICIGVLLLMSDCNRLDNSFDIVVYGGSPAGIAAAIQAKEMGKRVILIAPEGRIGGLTTSGLGATDMGNKKKYIGGLARTFYRKVKDYYFNDPSAWKQESLQEFQDHALKKGIDEDAMWFFEPHVAYEIYTRMLEEAGVEVILSERLDLREGIGVQKKDSHISGIQMESGKIYRAKIFIDATYEGDLMAKAGVSYMVGRESNDQYGETLNGIQLFETYYNLHLFARKVDPYKIKGDPDSGLIFGIQESGLPGENGEGDHRVQAYCFRLCLTDVPENQVPFPKPENYDPAHYELLLRYIHSKEKFPWVPQERADTIENMVLGWNPTRLMMPNRKTDSNTRGPISFNFVGGNYNYPDGDYAERKRIVEAHKNWQQGLIWFLAHDPRIPAEFSEPIKKWGLARDEFMNNDNWPPQLYIREARRMVSDYVMTEKNCTGERIAENSVGLASYPMDSHICSRYVHTDGWVRNEGHIGIGVKQPYPVSYQSIVPREEECSNLLVPVCLSASHAAYGSIRMEPVYMMLGQSAGIAAAIAIDDGLSIQAVDYQKLSKLLIENDQVLQWEEK